MCHRKLRPAFAAAVGLTAFLLGGCAGGQLVPPGMPSVPQVTALYASTAAIPQAGIHDFYTSGLTLVQMNCEGFFSQAVMNALSAAQTTGNTQLLAGLISGLGGIAGLGGPAVGAAGLGASTIAGLISNQQQNSLAGTDPAASYTLTTTAQQMLINAIPEPTSGADAWAAIYSIERECSPAGIRAKQEQAIAAAPSHLSIVGQPAIGPVPSGVYRRYYPMTKVN